MPNIKKPGAAPTIASIEHALVRDVAAVRHRLRHLFQDPLTSVFGDSATGGMVSQAVGWVPAVDTTDTAAELTVTVELPGLKPEEVVVECDNDVLTIRGNKTDEKKSEDGSRRHLVWERTYGAFQRSFILPHTIDSTKVSAEFTNGVLTVHVPKTVDASGKSRRVAITAK
jgi:HSP20 family protein